MWRCGHINYAQCMGFYNVKIIMMADFRRTKIIVVGGAFFVTDKILLLRDSAIHDS